MQRGGARRNFLGSVDVAAPYRRSAGRQTPSTRGAGTHAVGGDPRGMRCDRCVLSGDVAESAGHLVWIDCEMTGLDLATDKLIEIAVLVTDSDLNVLDPGLDLVISADEESLTGMADVVTATV